MASKSTGTRKKTTGTGKSSAPIPIDSGHGAVMVEDASPGLNQHQGLQHQGLQQKSSPALGHGPANVAPIPPYNGIGLEDEIRRRAYELYLERGARHGAHHEDWMRAESEILAKYRREKSA